MLFRHYSNVKVLHWIDCDHFVGTVQNDAPWRRGPEFKACYGWTKGKSFFIYIIEDGHIEKIGTVKEVLDTARPDVVRL